MKKADSNKDGKVSIEEWDAAVAKIESEMLAETLKTNIVDSATDVIITKGDAEKIFMISDYSQESLLRKLSRESLLGIYGGVALSLATLAYLLFRFGIF
jgi:predicted Zn-dependent protease with MMP-like domain